MKQVPSDKAMLVIGIAVIGASCGIGIVKAYHQYPAVILEAYELPQPGDFIGWMVGFVIRVLLHFNLPAIPL